MVNTLHCIKSSPQPNEESFSIQTKSLDLKYGNKQVLGGVNFYAPTKKVTALVGPSGCGKSSFLSCLNRLVDMIPNAAISGEVWIKGENILDPGINLISLRKRVGMVFQQPNPFPLSIRDNIQLALRDHGCRNKHTLTEITENVLQEVGLWDEVKDRLNHSALQLSGGQQQRLCIARALALDPEILLLDEPCSALDPMASAVIEEKILELKRHYTVIVVTHNLSQAKRVSDHCALFWLINGVGSLIEQNITNSFFTNPSHTLTNEYIKGIKG